jgi:hypothetical protein
MRLAFQWRKNGMEIPDATSSALRLPAAIVPDCGAAFEVVVSNSLTGITSAAATLTVRPAPGAPVITTNPVRVRVLANQTGTFSVSASSPTPMSFQWQRGTFTGNMANIPSATNATYTTAPATPKDHHTLFRCIVSNAAGNAASASEMLFVTNAPTPAPPSAVAGTTDAWGVVWHEVRSNPRLAGVRALSWHAAGCTDPALVRAPDGTLTVWFTTMGIKRDKDGKFAADGPWIGRATGADAPSPVLKIAPDEPVTGLGAEGSWNDARVLAPDVIVEPDGSLLMSAYGQSKQDMKNNATAGSIGFWRSGS